MGRKKQIINPIPLYTFQVVFTDAVEYVKASGWPDLIVKLIKDSPNRSIITITAIGRL